MTIFRLKFAHFCLIRQKIITLSFLMKEPRTDFTPNYTNFWIVHNRPRSNWSLYDSNEQRHRLRTYGV